MTAIIKEFHTHARGEGFGWWASAIHPAHLDPEHEGRFLKGTEWRVSVSNCHTLSQAEFELAAKICEAIQTSLCGWHDQGDDNET